MNTLEWILVILTIIVSCMGVTFAVRTIIETRKKPKDNNG